MGSLYETTPMYFSHLLLCTIYRLPGKLAAIFIVAQTVGRNSVIMFQAFYFCRPFYKLQPPAITGPAAATATPLAQQTGPLEETPTEQFHIDPSPTIF
jgi:hypothetical protein